MSVRDVGSEVRRSRRPVWAGLVLTAALGCGDAGVSTADSSMSSSTTLSGTATSTSAESGPAPESSSGLTSGSVGDTTGSASSSGSGSGSGSASSPGLPPGVPPGYLVEPDVGGSYECSPWDQNCPSGEKCAAWANDGGSSWNAYRCVPVASDPDGPGDACTVEDSGVTGIDSCDAHSMCFQVDENLEGECHPYCVGSENNPQCNQPDHFCSVGGSGFALCLPTCNPLLSDCGAGQGCYPGDGAFVCAPDASGPAGAAGDPCEFINACDSGLICTNPPAAGGCAPGSGGCCTATCDITADDCVAPQSCVSWWLDYAPPPFGQENVGVCLESK